MTTHRCAVVEFGRPCKATSKDGIGWLEIVLPDGATFHVCDWHKVASPRLELRAPVYDPYDEPRKALRRLSTVAAAAAGERARAAEEDAEMDARDKALARKKERPR